MSRFQDTRFPKSTVEGAILSGPHFPIGLATSEISWVSDWALI